MHFRPYVGFDGSGRKDEKMKLISVVVPCYNEREVLPAMYAELENVRKRDFDGIAEFEYIFADDGSSDGTTEYIKEMRKKYENQNQGNRKCGSKTSGDKR